jgi:uncharacterized membrane-anchored protein YhcB (DUF1043 family)
MITREARWLVALVALAIVLGVWLGATIFRLLT